MEIGRPSQYDFIFNVKGKDIESIIYEFGTKYDRMSKSVLNAKMESDEYIESKDFDICIFEFLQYVEFIDDNDHYLTDIGKSYFKKKYILNENDVSEQLMIDVMCNTSLIGLVYQVFYGRGKISIEQLKNLLNYHKVTSYELENKDITSFLSLLNNYNVAVYDKKNKQFSLNVPFDKQDKVEHSYISPSTPFSNIVNLRRAIRNCTGDVYWLDKHFRKEGLEFILDGLPPEGISSITIVSGKDNVTKSAHNDYHLLKQELLVRNINVSWRIMDNTDFKWHDRWLLSESSNFNIPPVLSIIRGQRADIIQIDKTPPIDSFIENSHEIDSLFGN